MSVVAFAIMRTQKDFHSGILKLFEGNFHQGIKVPCIDFPWRPAKSVSGNQASYLRRCLFISFTLV